MGQKCRQWDCAVVGHEVPERGLDLSEHVSFHSVDDLEAVCFAGWTPAERQKAITEDKNTKLYQAVLRLQGKGITHWFALDAEGLLRHDFVEHALSLDSAVGGVIRKDAAPGEDRAPILETQSASVGRLVRLERALLEFDRRG